MAHQKKYELQPVNNRNIYKQKPKYNNKTKYFPKTPFSRNVMGNARINTGNKDVSGYVKREVYMRDSHGNVQVAREVQVLNSWKKIGHFSSGD